MGFQFNQVCTLTHSPTPPFLFYPISSNNWNPLGFCYLCSYEAFWLDFLNRPVSTQSESLLFFCCNCLSHFLPSPLPEHTCIHTLFSNSLSLSLPMFLRIPFSHPVYFSISQCLFSLSTLSFPLSLSLTLSLSHSLYQVGGGTKTRRPVALRMQYNPSCTAPMCFLTLENGKEEQKALADIQAYIESENKRLERDPSRCFDAREINIRMEYRYCPNMIVIDTPGMLHPPKVRTHLIVPYYVWMYVGVGVASMWSIDLS